MIVEDFGARSAGAGVAHHPEIIGSVARPLVVADAHDALAWHTDLLGPEAIGFVVFGIHRHPQPLGRQLEDLGEQLPSVGDGLALEVVAEAEVAQHLEESVVPRGVADVFQVVVLAAGTHAFLRRGGTLVGAFFQTEEDVLELVHAGVGEEQRRVALGHERAGRHDRMPLAREEVEEGFADVGCFHGMGVEWDEKANCLV